MTGAGGPFARALLPVLCADAQIEAVSAPEVHLPRFEHPKFTGRAAEAHVLRTHDAMVHVPAPDGAHATPGAAEAAAREAHKRFLAARAAGVRRLIHVSTAAVYGPAVHAAEQAPLHPLAGFAFAEEQAHLERLLAIDVPECVRLRPHLVVGPHAQRALKVLLRQPFYLREHARALFQCLHEDDLADAIVRSLRSEARGAYNLATEDSFSLRDALAARHTFTFGVSMATATRLLAIGARLFRLDADAAWIERATHTLLVNCRRAAIELGWRPTYTALDALATV